MSELEICQFAYEGNIQQIINKTKETPTLLHKTDQVIVIGNRLLKLNMCQMIYNL